MWRQHTSTWGINLCPMFDELCHYTGWSTPHTTSVENFGSLTWQVYPLPILPSQRKVTFLLQHFFRRTNRLDFFVFRFLLLGFFVTFWGRMIAIQQQDSTEIGRQAIHQSIHHHLFIQWKSRPGTLTTSFYWCFLSKPRVFCDFFNEACNKKVEIDK